MALATQCPHCQTTFRVANDQLKLRAGLVRCGHCKEIFNGIEHLLPAEDAMHQPEAVAQRPIVTAAPLQPESTITHFAEDQPATDAGNGVAHPYAEAAQESAAAGPSSTVLEFDIPQDFERDVLPVSNQYTTQHVAEPVDPLQRMTLMDFTRDLPDSAEEELDTHDRAVTTADATGDVDPAAPDELDDAIDDLQRKPWRGSGKSADRRATGEDRLDEVDAGEDEPAFLTRGRRQQQRGKKLRVALLLGILLLLLAALVQGTYAFRNQIAGMFPQVKPALNDLCKVAGCGIALPAQIATVSIESSELQTLADNKQQFVLTALLRNYSDTLQEWPHIELTLNDASEKPLLRRVFKPGDYIGNANDINAGFAAASERSVKLAFALSDIKASGYRVYLFYP